MALVKRTMLAQVDMAVAMGVAPPAYLSDVLAHFPAWNTAEVVDGDNGKDTNTSSANTHVNTNGKSNGKSNGTTTVFTAYANATAAASDAFAIYPVWPSELVNGLDADHATVDVARASFVEYFTAGDSNSAGSRPVLVYPAAVRAGGCAGGLARRQGVDEHGERGEHGTGGGGGGVWCRTATEVLGYLQTWLKKAQTASYIPVHRDAGARYVFRVVFSLISFLFSFGSPHVHPMGPQHVRGAKQKHRIDRCSHVVERPVARSPTAGARRTSA